MSRVGRLPIPVPEEVTVKIEDGKVTVKGPKGELNRQLGDDISVSLEDGEMVVSRANDTGDVRARHGLMRALLANMVTGVTKGFDKGIEIVGVGYRAQKNGDKVVLNVGFSHPVEIEPMPGVVLVVEGNNRVRVTGIDKEIVGLMASKIIKIKPHDAYKGKGLRYVGELIRLKPGKAGKAIGK